MKKTILFRSLIVLFSIISLVSCEIEPLDTAIDLADFAIPLPNNPNNPNNGAVTGDYWPTAINNQWVYKRDGVEQSPLKIISTQTFSGLLYHKFEQTTSSSGGTSATAYSYIHKSNGDYTYKIDETAINAGGLTGTQTGYEYIVLKEYLNVNETWSGSYTQTTTYVGIPPIVLTVDYEGKILEKGISVSVDGQNYTDVIKSRITLEVLNQGTTSITTTDYWYAKNIGPVKYVSTSSGSTTTSNLMSYILN